MRKKTRFHSVMALALCTAMLATTAGWPLRTFASIDDETGESVDVVEAEYQENDSYTADSELEEEVTASSETTDSKTRELQAQMDEIAREKEALEKAAKELQATIDDTKDEKQKAQAVQNSIYENINITEGHISLLQQNISLLQENISVLEQDIGQKEEDIQKKQGEIDDRYALFKIRLKSKYMQDNGTIMGLVLGADSFADFLTRSEYMARIGQYDQELMAQLSAERKDLEEDKAALENRKTEVEANRSQIESNKAETESKKQELNKQYNVAALQVQDIERQEKEYLADLAKNKALQDAATAEMDRIFQAMQWKDEAYAGGEMAWPLPGHYTLTSRFGYRFGGSDFHTGIDISSNGSGCYGATIVAANDGTVVKVNTAYTPGVGYGKYVMIDHGGQIATLYGHCSEILVSEGQQVTRGQAIAKVGATGWATGPHLHFEVRINGKHVEPGQYIGV